MDRTDLRERISTGLFLLDGAMGTELFARGVEQSRCIAYLNIESADIVFDVHASYIKAGSDAVLTNTFGANKFVLDRHGHSDMIFEINKAAAQIGRRAAGEGRYVLGDIGPSGEMLEPIGLVKPGDLKAAFTEQGRGLLEGGVDGFIIETMTAVEEAVLAVEAARSVCDLPVFASMSFEKHGNDFRTMMGVGADEAAGKLIDAGVEAAGFNCGKLSLEDYVELADRYVSAVSCRSEKVAVFAELNAGMPVMVDEDVTYTVSAEEFLAAVEKIHSAGVNILGGCCGTTPAHIAALANGMKK